jgi:hypothetical protein
MRGICSNFAPNNEFICISIPFFRTYVYRFGLATKSLRGSFATFLPTFKIFWLAIAFLDFSVQIYFQQASW